MVSCAAIASQACHLPRTQTACVQRAHSSFCRQRRRHVAHVTYCVGMRCGGGCDGSLRRARAIRVQQINATVRTLKRIVPQHRTTFRLNRRANLWSARRAHSASDVLYASERTRRLSISFDGSSARFFVFIINMALLRDCISHQFT